MAVGRNRLVAWTRDIVAVVLLVVSSSVAVSLVDGAVGSPLETFFVGVIVLGMVALAVGWVRRGPVADAGAVFAGVGAGTGAIGFGVFLGWPELLGAGIGGGLFALLAVSGYVPIESSPTGEA